MKLWRFTEPVDHRFARASRVGGTWQSGEYKKRVSELTIEWEPGSATVGDFTWPGLDTDIVVTERVAKALDDGGVEGFELRPVQMQVNASGGNQPKIQLPYGGPALFDLWVTSWTAIDRGLSTIRQSQQSDGSHTFEPIGVQRWEQRWDSERQELISELLPRVEGKGLVVAMGTGLFRVDEFPAWIFCSDQVKVLLETHDFTNVAFLEMGSVVSD